ncbi:hypothetical protein G5C45_28775 [Burkholderia pseudomallei]|nr:hypothetical protein [Burkholderia pseudomallei]MBD2953325.1 hypothetical protein [Burkholderia pseudomallei]MBD2987638.1 hypothetical protein [Burkholderia pseudomallei]MBD2995811.1 hypothetical protein [Burkholderia pseudomallei]MBF3556534.1 hypothetical protein [Burkholderia pseudomallei]
MPKKAARGAPDATKNAAACRHRAMPAAFRARRAMSGNVGQCRGVTEAVFRMPPGEAKRATMHGGFRAHRFHRCHRRRRSMIRPRHGRSVARRPDRSAA